VGVEGLTGYVNEGQAAVPLRNKNTQEIEMNIFCYLLYSKPPHISLYVSSPKLKAFLGLFRPAGTHQVESAL